MAAGHRDVIDSQVGFVASAQFENIFLGCGPDYMDDSAGVFLLVKGLEYHIVALLVLVVHKFELIVSGLDHQRVGFLANLTLEGLPEERAEVGRLFRLTLDFEPRLEALQVDAAY